MKATIDVPDPLYRQVKARSAMSGRSVRDVTIELYRRWLTETADPETETRGPSASGTWLARWQALGTEIASSATDERTTREVLQEDRR